MLCGVMVWENQETYEKVNWRPWYDLENVKYEVKPQSINQSISNWGYSRKYLIVFSDDKSK